MFAPRQLLKPVRIDEDADWPRILRFERDFDINADWTYRTFGYMLSLRRHAGEMRYAVYDGVSIAPVGALILHASTDGRVVMAVTGRASDVLADDVPRAGRALDVLAEHLRRQDLD